MPNLTSLQKLLFTYMVTNYLFEKIIFLSVQCIHCKLVKLNFAVFSTIVELMVVANLGKNLQSSVPKRRTDRWLFCLYEN